MWDEFSRFAPHVIDDRDPPRRTFESVEAGGGTLWREGFQGGVFYLLVSADGRILANPQNVDLSGLARPPSMLTAGS